MSRADARSAQIRSPKGVTRSFHVISYKVEPGKGSNARNLFSKHHWRCALAADDVIERRPQVPLVSKPTAFACRGERLARAGSGPDGAVLWPSCEAQRKAPPADSGEEVALGKSVEFAWADVFNGSFVHNSGWYVFMLYEFP
jgi:hypothetical protein